MNIDLDWGFSFPCFTDAYVKQLAPCITPKLLRLPQKLKASQILGVYKRRSNSYSCRRVTSDSLTLLQAALLE